MVERKNPFNASTEGPDKQKEIDLTLSNGVYSMEDKAVKPDVVPNETPSSTADAKGSTESEKLKTEPTVSAAEAAEVTLNKAVEKVKEGDFSSLASEKVISGAAQKVMLNGQQRDFEELKSKSKEEIAAMAAEAIKEAEAKSAPEGLADDKDISKEVYEKARAEWKEARGRAHKLEAEYNQKYQEHIQSQSMVGRWARRTFGFQPKLNAELEALQGASTIARRDYQAAGKKLAEARDTKPMIKYSAITKSPEEYAGRDAVDKRYQRMLAHHLITETYRKRLETQENAINVAWGNSRAGKLLQPALETLKKHKYLTMAGLAVGATGMTVMTGGLFAAGLAGGLGAGLGTYQILDKTWVAGGRKKLANAKNSLGDDFFNKSFAESDKGMEYLTYDVETRKALTKTASKIAGVAGGMTAVGLAFPSGEQVVGISPGGPDAGGADIGSDLPADQTPDYPGQKGIGSDYSATHQHAEMGDLKVMEELNERTSQVIDEINAGIRPQPEFIDVVPPNDGPALHPEVDGTPVVPEVAPDVFYTVEPGGKSNAWNAMEGFGPDSNPKGGLSEVVKDMSRSERNYWLDKLVEYYEQHPDEARDVGAIKSNGNIHMVHPGERLNITMMDNRLLELMHQDSAGNIPVPEPRPETVLPSEAPIPEARPDIDSTQVISPTANETGTVMTEVPPEAVSETVTESIPEVVVDEPVVTDANKLTIKEFIDLSADVAMMKPEATARLEAMRTDAESFVDMAASLSKRVMEGEFDENMTVSEALKNSTRVPDSPPADLSVPAAASFNNTLPQPGDMPIRDASFAANDNINVDAGPSPEIAQQNVDAYVKNIENPEVGIFERLLLTSSKNMNGTFDQIANMSVNDMMAADAQNTMPAGVSEEGWNRWVTEVKELNRGVPANDNLSVGELVSRAANSRAA